MELYKSAIYIYQNNVLEFLVDCPNCPNQNCDLNSNLLYIIILFIFNNIRSSKTCKHICHHYLSAYNKGVTREVKYDLNVMQ